MPRLTIALFVIALIAGFVGFAGVDGYSWNGARTLFYVFITFSVMSFLGRMYGRQSV